MSSLPVSPKETTNLTSIPGIFTAVDAVVLNKIDLAPYVDFGLDAMREGVWSLNPGAELFEVSCRTGEGVARWAEWLVSLARSLVEGIMEPVSALRIHVKGVVQGVGFRPFVYSLAARHQVKGWVLNSTSGVVIEVEGAPSALDLFCRDLVELSPPMSRIEEVEKQPVPARGHLRFDIRESEAEAGYVLDIPRYCHVRKHVERSCSTPGTGGIDIPLSTAQTAVRVLPSSPMSLTTGL